MERHPKIIIGKTKTSCLSAIKDNMWLSMVMPLKCTSSKVLVLLRTERERNTVGKKNYTTADSLGCWGPGSPYRSVPGTSSGPWWLCLLSFSLLLSGSRARCFTDRETAFSGCETAKDIENQERKKLPGPLKAGAAWYHAQSPGGSGGRSSLARGGGDGVGEAKTACCAMGTRFSFPTEKTRCLGTMEQDFQNQNKPQKWWSINYF